MSLLAIRRIFAYSAFFWLLILAQTRPLNSHSTRSIVQVVSSASYFDWSTVRFKSPTYKTGAKPYHINISGKRVSIKSNQEIKSVMVWTSKGDRIVEQTDLNESSVSFELNVGAKGYYMRIQMADDKSFTERF